MGGRIIAEPNETRESESFWWSLLELIDEERVIPVVGQDLLAVEINGTRTFLYRHLAELLAANLQVSNDALPEGDELNEVACRYMKRGGAPQKVYSGLKFVVSKAGQFPIPKPLEQLAAIRHFQLFVTTTFDSSLVQALNKIRFGGNPRTRVMAFPTRKEDGEFLSDLKSTRVPLVYHLLGRLSAIPDYAVTQEDMIEFFHLLQSENNRPALLFDELNRKSLLLVGCSFGDWLTRFFMRMSKHERLSAARATDFVADAKASNDPDLVLFLDRFSSGTNIYRSGGAVEFVDELHRRWQERQPASGNQATTLTEPAVGSQQIEARPGSVFLSYASEDRPAVLKIKEALEAAGMDVFFDAEKLQGGDRWEAKLERVIRECSLFIPVISQQTLTMQRRFFKKEWNLALEEAQMAAFSDEQTFLLPVVIDGTKADEPEIPERFRKTQWHPLPGGQPTSEFVRRVQQLYRKVKKDQQVVR